MSRSLEQALIYDMSFNIACVFIFSSSILHFFADFSVFQSVYGQKTGFQPDLLPQNRKTAAELYARLLLQNLSSTLDAINPAVYGIFQTASSHPATGVCRTATQPRPPAYRPQSRE